MGDENEDVLEEDEEKEPSEGDLDDDLDLGDTDEDLVGESDLEEFGEEEE